MTIAETTPNPLPHLFVKKPLQKTTGKFVIWQIFPPGRLGCSTIDPDALVQLRNTPDTPEPNMAARDCGKGAKFSFPAMPSPSIPGSP